MIMPYGSAACMAQQAPEDEARPVSHGFRVGALKLSAGHQSRMLLHCFPPSMEGRLQFATQILAWPLAATETADSTYE